jgi:transglutaminase-like putative cysteine protease
VVRTRARDLALGGPAAIRQWLNRRFRFVRDPQGVELLKSPEVMLQESDLQGEAAGDCDDAAILGASVALASGYRVRWVVLGFQRGGPYGHVYAEANDGHGWQDFDVTRPAQFPPGLKAHRRLVIPLR